LDVTKKEAAHSFSLRLYCTQEMEAFYLSYNLAKTLIAGISADLTLEKYIRRIINTCF